LVFARIAALACRTGQALFRTAASDHLGNKHVAPLRLQLYVDDPVATT